MSHPMSLELKQKTSQNIQQLQRLIMSKQMQQALHLLQMPIMEIAPAIEAEMEQNPIIEYIQDEEDDHETEETQDEPEEGASQEVESDEQPELSFEENNLEVLKQLDDDFYDYLLENNGYVAKKSRDDEELQSFLESSIRAKSSLFEHLAEQIRETFDSEREREIANEIAGNIDTQGYLTTSIEEIATTVDAPTKEVERILTEIQHFHPAGIGARSLKESLLIQLKYQGKEKSLAYTIVDKHLDDLLHNRIPQITKHLKCRSTQIANAIEDTIAKLDIHPGTSFSNDPISYISPDAAITEINGALNVSINQEAIPRIRVNRRYLKMLDDATISKETKEFIKQKIISAKWLVKNVMQRNTTIQNIAEALTDMQKEFFLNPTGKLLPLTMKTVANKIGIHESTIARAVANKYVDTPRGLFPLRFFFTNALIAKNGEEISSKNVRDLLKSLLAKESKKKPLSDQELCALMKESGVNCARRTIAKYRAILNVGNAQQRKKF